MFDWFMAFLEWGETGWWQKGVVSLAVIWALYGVYVVMKKFAGDAADS